MPSFGAIGAASMDRMVHSTGHRRSIRLRDFDYTTAGAYFVTIVTQSRRCLLGSVDQGVMRLTGLGQFVDDEWVRMSELRPGVELDTFVVMPNHFHAVLWIAPTPGADDEGMASHAPTRRAFSSPVAGSLGNIVGGLKSAVTRRAHTLSYRGALWQRGYYEHVIRDEDELQRIRQYIADNPAKWADDAENPARRRVATPDP